MIDAAALGAEAARRLARHVRPGGTGDASGISLAPGLTDAEFAAIEEEFGFQFADDHRAFLAAGLPLGDRWPDWRDGDPAYLRGRLGWPVAGVLFDVEHNEHWRTQWGTRPAVPADAVAVARARLATVPVLVPVYSHRYLPAGHGTAGHPVLSVHQTDIIVYGLDLADYVEHEFDGPGRADPRRQPEVSVEFWRDYL